MPRLRTDWVCIATAGFTADRREIKEEWLLQAAENYSRQCYTALLWPRHDKTAEDRAWSYNYGEVDALKAERADGVLKLYAQLIPNDWLIATNASGQKLFTSVELAEDFAGTGQYYLTGVAVTDIPASLGTDRMMFSVGGEQYPLQSGGSEPLTFSLQPAQSPQATTKRTFLARFFSRGKEETSQSTEENEMTKEQFEALMGRMDKQDEAVAGIQEQVKAFTAGSATPSPEPEKPAVPEATVTGVTSGQFTQLEGKIDGLVQQFAQIAATATTRTPSALPGEGDDNKVWL